MIAPCTTESPLKSLISYMEGKGLLPEDWETQLVRQKAKQIIRQADPSLICVGDWRPRGKGKPLCWTKEKVEALYRKTIIAGRGKWREVCEDEGINPDYFTQLLNKYQIRTPRKRKANK